MENDTVEIDNNDITYFEVLFNSGDDKITLFPKVQTDSNSDMIVFSPDVNNDILEATKRINITIFLYINRLPLTWSI